MDIKQTCSTVIARRYLCNSRERHVATTLRAAWKYSPSFAALRRMSKYAALVANDCSFAKKKFKKYEFINNERVGETEQFYRHDKHFLRI